MTFEGSIVTLIKSVQIARMKEMQVLFLTIQLECWSTVVRMIHTIIKMDCIEVTDILFLGLIL